MKQPSKEQKKVFTGLADIECTVLRFTDNVLEGETQKFPPYWAGIDKISEILRDFRTKTEELRTSNVLTQLNSIKTTSDNNKETFENQLASGDRKSTRLKECRSEEHTSEPAPSRQQRHRSRDEMIKNNDAGLLKARVV